MPKVSVLKRRYEAAAKEKIAAHQKFMAAKQAYEDAEVKPKLKGMIGKCFKYRNSYSCPSKLEDYWWLWRRVVSVDGGMLVTSFVERDKYGHIFIKEDTTTVDLLGEEVPYDEWLENVRETMNKACETIGLISTRVVWIDSCVNK